MLKQISSTALILLSISSFAAQINNSGFSSIKNIRFDRESIEIDDRFAIYPTYEKKNPSSCIDFATTFSKSKPKMVTTSPVCPQVALDPNKVAVGVVEYRTKIELIDYEKVNLDALPTFELTHLAQPKLNNKGKKFLEYSHHQKFSVKEPGKIGFEVVSRKEESLFEGMFEVSDYQSEIKLKVVEFDYPTVVRYQKGFNSYLVIEGTKVDFDHINGKFNIQLPH